MRFERVRLKNFAGVDAVEVAFSATGITLIYGANETGKSTLMTAIDMLFDHRDDSNKREVKAFRPLHRDAGAEVEADVQVGAYRFTYMKRFHKDRKTELRIHEPSPQSLTGREAHDRVRDILDASVDTGLWQALRILQGGNTGMPELHDQRALAVALDKAAGQAQSGDRENALVESAREECAIYYTEAGRERETPIGHARARLAQASAAEKSLKEATDALRADIDRHAQVERSLLTVRASLDSLDQSEQVARSHWAEVASMSEDRDRTQEARNLAAAAMQTASDAVARRAELIEDFARTVDKVERAQAACAEMAEALASAEDSLELAKRERDRRSDDAQACAEAERLRTADLDYLKDEQDLARINERLTRIAAAEEEAAQAKALVASSKMTEVLRARIRDAEIQLNTTRSILDLALPTLTVTATESFTLNLGGNPARLKQGEVRTMSIDTPLTMGFGQLAELQIVPGTSADEQRQQVRLAEKALADACDKAGVSSPAEAETAWEALVEAHRAVVNRDRALREYLGEFTREALVNQAAATKLKLDTYRGTRKPETPLPSTQEECRHLLESAAQAANAARSALRTAEAVYTAVQAQHASHREAHAICRVTLEREQQDLAQARSRLEEGRRQNPDASLNAALAEAGERMRAADQALEEAVRRVQAADPDAARFMMESAVAAARTARITVEAQDRELTVLATRLAMQGEQGLAERLAEAERESSEAESALQSLLRRANSARLLYETLESERLAMRQAYVAPLRIGIEKLGRHLFGLDFRVEVDEQLQVVSRTKDGVTVPTEQLSTGAQEQIGLLVRLAAASMVSEEGGVPLVLDDALGFTDQLRLESLGAILGLASQNTQTIILTCAPERYQHVKVQQTFEIRK